MKTLEQNAEDLNTVRQESEIIRTRITTTVENIKKDIETIEKCQKDLEKRFSQFKSEVKTELSHFESGFEKKVSSLASEVKSELSHLESGFEKKVSSLATENKTKVDQVKERVTVLETRVSDIKNSPTQGNCMTKNGE